VNAVLDNLGRYGEGMWGTVSITLLAFVLAFVLGMIVATCRISPIPPLRWAGTAWVEGLRNVPLMALLWVFFFGFTKLGISYSPWASAILVCGAYTSAFVAETVRSGFNAVPPGQAEAARSLGLTFPQVLATVVWPQALRSIVPPMGSVFIALTKNSSLAFSIGAIELTSITQELVNKTAQSIPLFLGTATAYLLLTLPSGQAIAFLERRVAIKR
jgi:His/Glu/Gln/Arg/opine family amino acid ABC transporter permease subunit